MTDSDKNMNKNDILEELILKQRKNIPSDVKFTYSDLKRISKYIDSSIFDENECCIWGGYVTNNNTNKGKYINFYFKKRKIALHRLLYYNFVDDISSTEYIRFNCENRGKCCNINHLEKFEYNLSKKTLENKKKKENIVKKKLKMTKKEIKDKLTIIFD